MRSGDVGAIQQELLRHGPIVLEIDGALLKSVDGHGVVRDQTVQEPNHAVSVVGWAPCPTDGVGCWVLRNSWGGERVPKDAPVSESCVGVGYNVCSVEYEAWTGMPTDPGFALLPFHHPSIMVDEPWIACTVACQI